MSALPEHRWGSVNREQAPNGTQEPALVSAPPRGAAPPGMQWIPGGSFVMGSDRHYLEERPAHTVSVAGFWMARFEVTNADFARFVAATRYRTQAERPPAAAETRDSAPELMLPASVVFRRPARPVGLNDPYQWWAYVPGADWRHPRGPGSNIDRLEDHPVVHVSYADVEAYLAWSGLELPTEAEWEFAARGGLDGKEFTWGDQLYPGNRPMANTWQGEFPHENLLVDGYEWTAPVGDFPANGYGLYDMIGNVWEWTADWYHDHSRADGSCCSSDNPKGGERDRSIDPRGAGARSPRKVIKGGSFLCAPNYCRRYRPAARMAQPVDLTTCHVGFRCVLHVPREEVQVIRIAG